MHQAARHGTLGQMEILGFLFANFKFVVCSRSFEA